ncbi:MAG: hypothetical protein WDN08_18140 [Rhizomicrobium sp.]
MSNVARSLPSGPAKFAGVVRRRRRLQRARDRLAIALHQRVGLAHRAQVADQLHEIAVTHHRPLDVGDRQGEAGALQQPAEIAHVAERRDARADAAGHRDLRRPRKTGATP